VAYMFIKSFHNTDNNIGSSALLRIAVIALGPVLWNAVVLITLFCISLFLGPALSSCCVKFPAVMAGIAHFLALVGMIAFIEFLWFLELWDTSHAVLGLLAVVFIQRAFNKLLISIFLTREFKHDETNRAWWSGKWYGRGLGSSAWSQPAREFIVKLVELSLWSGDLMTGHFLMFILTPPIFIPYVDRLHATMLFWLRPSKQIRAPLYSIKQKRQRRMIVVKYGVLYLLVLTVFVALIALPAIFRNYLNFKCSICNDF